jgi:hypothetical protein
MKVFGFVLIVLGIAGTVFFGLQAINNSETFSLFGLDVAVSKADWTPVLVSAAMAVLGLIVVLIKSKKR